MPGGKQYCDHGLKFISVEASAIFFRSNQCRNNVIARPRSFHRDQLAQVTHKQDHSGQGNRHFPGHWCSEAFRRVADFATRSADAL
jgi:hypothetical protein